MIHRCGDPTCADDHGELDRHADGRGLQPARVPLSVALTVWLLLAALVVLCAWRLLG